MFVVDASIALAWLLPDEETDKAETVMVLARRSGAIAPALFPLEVANALRSNLRRGRLDAIYRDAALDQLDKAAVARDLEAYDPTVLRETVRLSDKHDLTVYDAAYLELALRHDAPLGTLDDDLRRAAGAENVVLHP
ncbi:type II toxin-antitoxin system VapC family toxin [uncultured Brevundimonas sp.]|uniref:type II toxin-antitoxin system VapC family toxin n=1 Tax=uncultured Brevundimonas sp. TaxID=213418 RepID=UPI0030EB9397|tara:strand:- start:858 stop:1268 length:411 start_codon:yes stop_codon:yes gene_type:complete